MQQPSRSSLWHALNTAGNLANRFVAGAEAKIPGQGPPALVGHRSGGFGHGEDKDRDRIMTPAPPLPVASAAPAPAAAPNPPTGAAAAPQPATPAPIAAAAAVPGAAPHGSAVPSPAAMVRTASGGARAEAAARSPAKGAIVTVTIASRSTGLKAAVGWPVGRSITDLVDFAAKELKVPVPSKELELVRADGSILVASQSAQVAGLLENESLQLQPRKNFARHVGTL